MPMPSTRLWLSACWLFAIFPSGAQGQEPAARAAAAPAIVAPEGVFLVKPYLQWGRSHEQTANDSLALMWQTGDVDAAWTVEVKAAPDRPWAASGPVELRRVAVRTIAPHRIYTAKLAGLEAGTDFDYRVLKAGTPLFGARAHARKSADQPYRFVVFGDCAAGTPASAAIAHRAYLARPDFVFIPGDIVYTRGRISEYRTNFFPVYNADIASPAVGAPLLRSTLFLAAPGNHDTATSDLDRYPDGLAYFLYWSQPTDGTATRNGGPNTPKLLGSQANRQAFLDAAGTAYPGMANFSFNYANAHWTVLDSNTYVDWNDPALRAWLEHDLSSNANAAWRFVGFHHPGFNSSHKHFDEQRMRLLADVLERGAVDLVFTGHVHNYQRTFPLRFVAHKNAQGDMISRSGRVEGTWTLDKAFDGSSNTHPNGVVYLVTGAGGASRYDPEQQANPSSWQPFTHKFISTVHSITVVDISGRKLSVRQISEEGGELDAFRIIK
jgi:acid phosphatase type 7